MALIITAGAANSDSYADLATALAYTAARGVVWTGADADRETALRRATAWVDATYRGRFPGHRLNGRSQALEWPRQSATDAAGEIVESTTIPTEIVNATCEAAARELATPGGLSPDVTPSQSVRMESVGPISVTYAGRSDAEAYKPVLAVVNGILSSLIGGNTSLLLRA